MSLFEKPGHQWRETFFVMFQADDRPTAKKMESSLRALSKRFVINEVSSDDEGMIESLTLESPDDSAAMDITCVVGEEVREQIPGLVEEIQSNIETAEERTTLKRLNKSTARLDVFHFECATDAFMEPDNEDEFMDPGGLLIVLDHLADLCKGVVVDPQAGSLL
jgi:hypothetical protein